LFNYLIDHITIKEIEIFDNRKVILAVTIHLKLNGYAPKQTLEYLKNIRYKDSENTNDLPFGGGEGGISLRAGLRCPISAFGYFSLASIDRGTTSLSLFRPPDAVEFGALLTVPVARVQSCI